MSQAKLIGSLVVLGVAVYVLMGTIYTVNEVEQMIITQFGKPVGEPVTTAGLKIKIPFIQEVNPIDKRVLEWDGPLRICRPKTSSTYRLTCLPAGALLIPCNISCVCVMNAVPSPAWTIFWAVRHAMRWPSTS